MKNKRLLFAALFAAVMGMVACENENDLPQLPDGTDIPETYTVSLACGGELGMDVTYDPMSRTDADSNDLYGVQVMYTNESGVTKPYAYGLFDDPSKMTLTLLSKHSYSFQVLLVKDGKNTIYSDSITIDGVKNYLGYGLPFTNHDGTQQISTALTNKFNISEKVRLQSNSNIYVERIYAGTVQFQKNGSSTLYADCLTKKIDYYYGENTFTPTENNATLTVYMKRMVSGLRIEAGEFLTEGYLNVRLEGIENGVFKLTPDNKVIEDMYAYYRPIEWYSQESFDDACYSGYINNIYWQKNDSVQIKLNPSSHNIMFYRKKQTVIKIDYTPEDYESDEYTGNSVAISLEAPDIIVGADYNFTDKNSTVEW